MSEEIEQPARRARRKAITPVTGALAAVIVAAGGFIGGVHVQKSQAATPAAGGVGGMPWSACRPGKGPPGDARRSTRRKQRHDRHGRVHEGRHALRQGWRGQHDQGEDQVERQGRAAPPRRTPMTSSRATPSWSRGRRTPREPSPPRRSRPRGRVKTRRCACAERHLARLRWHLDRAGLCLGRARDVHPDHHDPVRDRPRPDGAVLPVAVRADPGAQAGRGRRAR